MKYKDWDGNLLPDPAPRINNVHIGDAQLYLQMSQKQTQAMKILVDCLPKTPSKQVIKDDGFDDFVNGREDI